MFSLKKVDDLRGREREEKGTTNSEPKPYLIQRGQIVPPQYCLPTQLKVASYAPACIMHVSGDL